MQYIQILQQFYYCYLDGGNESTAKIRVDLPEKMILTDDVTMEPIAASTPKKYMKKSYSISCCMNNLSQDTANVKTVINESSDQNIISFQLSKHSLNNELCNNNSNCLQFTTCRCTSTQFMEIYDESFIISDQCQLFNELEMPENIVPCTIRNDSTNDNLEKPAKSILNIYYKFNKNFTNDMNDTTRDLYVRNITESLGDDDNNNNNSVSYQDKNCKCYPPIINEDSKRPEEYFTLDSLPDTKLISPGIRNVPTNMETKRIPSYKHKKCKCVYKNKNYKYLSEAITKSIAKYSDVNECYRINSQEVRKNNQNLSNNVWKEKTRDPDGFISLDTIMNNDLPNNTKFNQDDTIVIAFSKPKFTQVLSEIKEHTRSLEKQIESINNIIQNINVLSEEAAAPLSSRRTNLPVFYENISRLTNESQTEELVDINNNNSNEQIIENNWCKCIKKRRALSTSSLIKSSVCQNPIDTFVDEKLIKQDDDNVVRFKREQQQRPPELEENLSYVEEMKEQQQLPSKEIKKQKEPDQMNPERSAPYKNDELERVPYLHKKQPKSFIRKDKVKSKTKDNCCDQPNCNTATIPYNSMTKKTNVSNEDTIYNLYLQTTFTQSSNFQIVAATSISSIKLNLNSTGSNDDLVKVKKSKISVDGKTEDKINKKVPFPDSLEDNSTTKNDLNPSISIQCITISNSSINCNVAERDSRIKEIQNNYLRDNVNQKKVIKSNKMSNKFKLRKS
ncbi:putative uncharacterized protein DDB_G0282499 isoform X2 [Polistes fuscatus]|uniref:putative uncharacterized protein DDB_G0282499 isoform X2 n=1 Tax=Polistes fuscatus TaxID=30207 RepID=UPI001CA87B36|nr:putative uncharacterized protein DDB_G0282499 isoform X2 [Polistes fuscatus]